MTHRPIPPSHTFQVIGLAGPRGAGKDTVGQLLATHCGFARVAFGDRLREEVAHGFRIDERMLLARETKEQPLAALALERCMVPAFVLAMRAHHARRGVVLDTQCPRSPRQILRLWGTEWRRAQNVDYWLTAVAMRISEMYRSAVASRFVITDVRMANEVELVRQYGGLLWQIKRPGCEAAPHEHESESSGGEFAPDTVIDNRHDVRHLQQLVLQAWDGRGRPRAQLEQAA